ncbi:unnamed protein product [Rotaria magnacalcarata]|nr:unnamed protein product [Rotaria magnacalcarata]
MRYQSIHAAISLDVETNNPIQEVTVRSENDAQNSHVFALIESIFETDEELNTIVNDERNNTEYFDSSRSLVLRCHLVYHKKVSQNDMIRGDDTLIFNFHQAAFDIDAMEVFLCNLAEAYTASKLSVEENNSIVQNVDCKFIHVFEKSNLIACIFRCLVSVTKRQMAMNVASTFWFECLKQYDFDRPLQLPFDRRCIIKIHRTQLNTSTYFDVGETLAQAFLNYATTNHVLPIHLVLACYFAFLFKMTNGECDLCIRMNTSDHCRAKLWSLTGNFINPIPLRCQIDPYYSFNQLVEYISQIVSQTLEYSYFPLEHILAQHQITATPAFLSNCFTFRSTSIEDNLSKVTLDDATIVNMSNTIEIDGYDAVNTLDFSISVRHNPTSGKLSFSIHAALDLFDEITVNKIAQRFHFMLDQIFFKWDQCRQPIYEFSVMLPAEVSLIESLIDTHISTPPVRCLHYEFVQQMSEHSQKLSVELDEQSLTYGELCHHIQYFALYLINSYAVKPGDIVCQCVERSVSMVIGIVSIHMVGAAYCGLSPHSPQQRLHTLVKETESRFVLVHSMTQNLFNDDVTTLDMDTIINASNIVHDVDLDQLSKVAVMTENIAYVIFTSGSTGIPKAGKLRHRNLIECIHTLIHTGIFSKNDVIIQIAHCSFDAHFLDIVGAIVIGGTLVMLHPKGNMDLAYLARILKEKQISYFLIVPSLINSLLNFLKENNDISVIKSLRSVCSGGEAITTQLVSLLRSYVHENCLIWNLYGPSEITICCTYHMVDVTYEKSNIPIGRSLPKYQCLVVNEMLQPVIVGQEGELFVGGVGVFAGYLGRDDLTAKVVIEIGDEVFYRTGDLVRLDSRGFLHYIGRKDHQVKLRGQRIELGEIEQCILQSSSKITACVVTKYDNEHLVAYIQSSDVDEKPLRAYCCSQLPPHMIPSKFIVLKQLPLNSNGKVDRKRLPSPDFASSIASTVIDFKKPRNAIEECVHSLWCEVLQHAGAQISIEENFFNIGGHSLLLIQLYHRYKSEFGFDTHAFPIAPFLQYGTIAEHAKLIETLKNNMQSTLLQTPQINQGNDYLREISRYYIS